MAKCSLHQHFPVLISITMAWVGLDMNGCSPPPRATKLPAAKLPPSEKWTQGRGHAMTVQCFIMFPCGISDPCELTLMPQMYTNLVLPMPSKAAPARGYVPLMSLQQLARAKKVQRSTQPRRNKRFDPKHEFFSSNQFLSKCHLMSFACKFLDHCPS